jgi:hypothetical protein
VTWEPASTTLISVRAMMINVYSVVAYQRALKALSRWWEERKAA